MPFGRVSAMQRVEWRCLGSTLAIFWGRFRSAVKHLTRLDTIRVSLVSIPPLTATQV
jgi:hypothetical protein